ncbi:peptide deformylase [Tamaricihabitans halophyticus]|uniref:Peptide deformylase n=1 Tax=Tamaricihabitans halophyticus TaxID=1262583 RepID=A0A4R2QY61_9PSEU|nr:peptide deformylase [Tamaricihabitans halophyticus]TCP55152.1 peptide deformylase [Tamaricihabitans halophyticus]
MAMRSIRYFGDPVLTTACEPVTSFDKATAALITDLLDTVEAPGRAGLAAPQIGVSLRAFSYLVDGKHGYVINPEIVELSEETHEIDEGCLSVPELWFPTVRAKYAVVRGVDLANEPVTVEGAGVMAQCLQHETDHLSGMLYLSRLDQDRRKKAMRAARETNWFWSR